MISLIGSVHTLFGFRKKLIQLGVIVDIIWIAYHIETSSVMNWYNEFIS
jgi:hypothetical protein